MPSPSVSSEEKYHKPTSVEDLTEQNIQTIARLERTSLDERSPSERVVDLISTFCGSMAFVYVHLIWFGVWIGLNQLPTQHKWHFDPY